MANNTQQLFGGSWTQEKLERVSKYLQAYTTIFKKNPKAAYFEITYLDAFAGTGYMAIPDMPPAMLIPEMLEGVEEYQKGSARRALEVEPSFDHYIFVEKDKKRFGELELLRKDFANRDILFVNEDANGYLTNWCKKLNTRKNRAVAFLDPFGTNVSWSTIEAIAETQAIDMWLLFPLFAVNRMLIRNQKPPESWAKRLTDLFGTPEWEQEFYVTREGLLEGLELIEKVAPTRKISDFFVRRLRTIFPAVADPRVLLNSKGSPLFLLCFAAGNPKGATPALKIANYLLGK